MTGTPLTFEQRHMDTRVTVKVHAGDGHGIAEKAEKAFRAFADLERRFSLFRPDSEIVRVNTSAGTPTAVSRIFFDTLAYAVLAAHASEGVFDPLVGRFTAPRAGVGDGRQGSSFRDIVLDEATSRVTIPFGGMLDLNSVVKGMALDLAAAAFAEQDAVLIEAGGDIRVVGLPPGRDAWEIGVRDPRDPRKILAVVPVRSGAICTSGEYFRGAASAAEGRRHLVDPRGDGAVRSIVSMTVLAPAAKLADVLSTAAYLMGPDEAAAFVERHDGASCLSVAGTGEAYASARLHDALNRMHHA